MDTKVWMAVMSVMSQATIAMADGKITAAEGASLVDTMLKAFNINTGDILEKTLAAFADGQLTADEIVGILTALLSLFGINVTGVQDLFGFETRDGNIYIRIGEDLLNKITLKTPDVTLVK